MPKPKTEEAESNNGMSTYYLATFFLFGLLSLYCLNFYMTWKDVVCLVEDMLPLVPEEPADGGGDAAAAEGDAAPAEEAAAEGGRRRLFDTLRVQSLQNHYEQVLESARRLQDAAAAPAATGITETQKKKAIAALSQETGKNLMEGSSTAINSLTMSINYGI